MMPIKYLILLFTLFPFTILASETNWEFNISVIRRMANLIPGPLPLRLNITKIAESERPKNVIVKGEGTFPQIMSRSAYQIVFPDGFIMVDSGMNLKIHQTFGNNKRDFYYAEKNRLLQKALILSKLNILTHEHADHIAGVVATPNFNKIAPKTMLLQAQAISLLYSPQRPQLKLNSKKINKYIIFNYQHYFPLASGIVLIKAPGHTNGSQMIYIKLQNDNEFLLVGDVAWHTDGIRKLQPKNASWIKENANLINDELIVLHNLLNKTNIHILVSHDNDQYINYKQEGIHNNQLELKY